MFVKENPDRKKGSPLKMMKSVFFNFIFRSQHIQFLVLTTWAWCERGTRILGSDTSGPWDPGPPSKFKSGTPGHPAKFKSGIPSLFFNEFFLVPSFFSEYSFAFFYLFIFVSILNKIRKNINCE